MKDFRNFPLWQKAYDLTNEVYDLTLQFPKEEKYVLTDQLRRASLSIPANIAESYGRFHKLDKVKFLYYSRGSLYETLNFLVFAERRNYISKQTLNNMELKIEEIQKNLYYVINHINSQKQ